MTITVTSLGTGAAYGAAANCDITGVTANRGNWIIVAVAADQEGTYGSYVTVDGDEHLKEVAKVTNAGNTVVTVFAGRLLFNVSSAIVRTITGDTCAAAGYKVTNLGGGTAVAWINQTAGTGSYSLYSGSVTRRGQACWFATDTITSVTFQLKRTGSPTGVVYCRAYNLVTGALLHTFGNMDAWAISTTPTDLSFNSASYSPPGNTPIAIVIEYAGGDASNYISLQSGYLTETPYNPSVGVTYTSSWVKDNTYYRLVMAGAKIEAATDKQASATGTSTSPSSGATGTLAQAAEFVLGAIGMEHKLTESTGSWTNPTTYTQIDGTSLNGSAANQVIRSAAKVVSSTTSQTAEIFGEDSADWAALCVTFMEYTAPAPTFKQSRALLGVGW